MAGMIDKESWDAGRTLGMDAYLRIAGENPDKRIGELIIAACCSARSAAGGKYETYPMTKGLMSELMLITFGTTEDFFA